MKIDNDIKCPYCGFDNRYQFEIEYGFYGFYSHTRLVDCNNRYGGGCYESFVVCTKIQLNAETKEVVGSRENYLKRKKRWEDEESRTEQLKEDKTDERGAY